MQTDAQTAGETDEQTGARNDEETGEETDDEYWAWSRSCLLIPKEKKCVH